MGKYRVLKQGETVVYDPDEYLFSRCCDCGLVHLVFLKAKRGNRVAVTTYRDERKTAACRRRRSGGLQCSDGIGAWRMARKRDC
jgi:uncharacterized Zn finger protein